MLRLVEGMTGPEIAARTGLTPDSVRVNLCRGMKLLREALARSAHPRGPAEMDPMDDEYLWDRTGRADEDVARLEALLAPFATSPADDLRPLSLPVTAAPSRLAVAHPHGGRRAGARGGGCRVAGAPPGGAGRPVAGGPRRGHTHDRRRAAGEAAPS